MESTYFVLLFPISLPMARAGGILRIPLNACSISSLDPWVFNILQNFQVLILLSNSYQQFNSSFLWSAINNLSIKFLILSLMHVLMFISSRWCWTKYFQCSILDFLDWIIIVAFLLLRLHALHSDVHYFLVLSFNTEHVNNKNNIKCLCGFMNRILIIKISLNLLLE